MSRMHFRIQIIAVSDSDGEQCQEVADLVRSEALTLETLGLTLLESKTLLHSVQAVVAQHQVAAALERRRPCPQCGKRRALKDNLSTVFRSVFGELSLPNPRWRHCECQSGQNCQEQEPNQGPRTFRPLAAILPERTSPELLYLESKWASLLSYGLTTKLLHDVLPIDEKHSQATVRNHLLRVAERSEQEMGAEKAIFIEGCQAERDCLPISDGPLSVGLDGGIVRARRKKRPANNSDANKAPEEKLTRTAPTAKTANLFEVIAGKSILSFRRDDPEDAPPSSKCFAMVQTFDKKPKRRLFDLLQSQGMQANQAVTFFSDGGDNVRRIPEFLNPDSEHILDWFHITMRLTVLNQCARGLPKSKQAKDTSGGGEPVWSAAWRA